MYIWERCTVKHYGLKINNLILENGAVLCVVCLSFVHNVKFVFSIYTPLHHDYIKSFSVSVSFFFFFGW